MNHLSNAPKELIDHLIFGLEHGITFKEKGIDPMIPFVIIVNNNNRNIRTLISHTPTFADEMFLKIIKEEKPDALVLLRDSYITYEDIKYDAVLAKVYDKNNNTVYVVAQRFHPKTENTAFSKIGHPVILRTEEL